MPRGDLNTFGKQVPGIWSSFEENEVLEFDSDTKILYFLLTDDDVVGLRNVISKCSFGHLKNQSKAICESIRYGDGACLSKLLLTPFGDALAMELLIRQPNSEFGFVYFLKNNYILFSMIFKRLLKCVTHQHELCVVNLLKCCITKRLRIELLILVDELWLMIKRIDTKETDINVHALWALY